MQKNWQEQIASFDDRMHTQKNFDIIKRRLEIDGHTAYLYMINGFCQGRYFRESHPVYPAP